MNHTIDLIAACGRGYLTYHEYEGFLHEAYRECFQRFPKLQAWAEAQMETCKTAYIQHRLHQGGRELLRRHGSVPHVAQINTENGLRRFASDLIEHAREAGEFFEGVAVPEGLRLPDDLLNLIGLPLVRLDEVLRAGDRYVLTIDATTRCAEAEHVLAVDLIERFVDLLPLLDFRVRTADERLVLIPNIFNRQGFGVMSQRIRATEEVSTVLIVANDIPDDPQYRHTLARQPVYLWPLILTLLDPAVIHANVGTGEFGLPLVPFMRPERTVIDFYDLVAFTPDAYLERLTFEPAAIRETYAYYFEHFHSIVHRCAPEITERIQDAYRTEARVEAVLEFAQEPMYARQRTADGTLRLVFGGDGIILANDPSDINYRAMVEAGERLCRENVHLELYPQPFITGFSRHLALDAFIADHGFTNMHGHTPLKEREFIRTMAEYDYAAFPFSWEIVGIADYNYIMPYKLMAYLRAGLPVVVRSHMGILVDMVRRHGIGVVLPEGGEPEFARWIEILNGQDRRALQANVLEFRETMRSERGAQKLLGLYLDRCPGLRQALPATIELRRQGTLARLQQAEQLLEHGEKHFVAGDLSRARHAFEGARALVPRSIRMLNDLAVLEMTDGELMKALEHLNLALNIGPLERDSILNCGELLERLGDPAAAKELYLGFLASHPSDPDVQLRVEGLS